jgi:hypothetical protein
MADLEKTADAIIKLTERWHRFWSSSSGWAPAKAATLLSNSRLDLQVELARCLPDWGARERDSDAHLVLAWANLGALVEGAMMLTCCVFYEDYMRDAEEAMREQSPDTLSLDPLRIFFTQHVWTRRQAARWDPWILHIQHRRNTIHAFRRRDLGDFGEFGKAVGEYYELMCEIEDRLPYP